jgi:endonuclease/exonuclease/phosphatase family metal-dependent hydrolase
MSRTLKLVLIILLLPVIAFIVYLAGVIIYCSLAQYRPPLRMPLPIGDPQRGPSPPGDTLTFITWNIGYGGLGQEMDFFYEDGKQVRPSHPDYEKYMEGIVNLIRDRMQVDFILFQEVDFHSKRSYFDDQRAKIKKEIPGYFDIVALNYKVPFVPLPLTQPMGKVNSGIWLASRFNPDSSWRVAFPADESWPTRLFVLTRCYTGSRFTFNNKQLTVINTHNSAYDETGEAKSIQLDMLRKELLDAHGDHRFVIAGGDWNQNPPDYSQQRIETGDAVKTIQPLIPATLMPEGWKWVYDPGMPTNRDVNEPYTKGRTPTTIIDYFLVSPNVEVLEVKTIYTGFEFTDHHPVYMKIRLISE